MCGNLKEGVLLQTLTQTFTFPGEGMYAVSLTASDALGVVSVFSDVISVVEPEEPEAIVPEILEASFEDNSFGRWLR